MSDALFTDPFATFLAETRNSRKVKSLTLVPQQCQEGLAFMEREFEVAFYNHCNVKLLMMSASDSGQRWER